MEAIEIKRDIIMKKLKIEYIETSQLKLFKDNLNVLRGDKYSALIKSIKDDGILEPLLVTEDNVVVDGNHRLAVAGLIGLKMLPCLRISADTAKKKMQACLNVNWFRGEISLDALVGYITHRIENGDDISDLSKELHMNTFWVLKYYDMRKCSALVDEKIEEYNPDKFVVLPLMLREFVAKDIIKQIRPWQDRQGRLHSLGGMTHIRLAQILGDIFTRSMVSNAPRSYNDIFIRQYFSGVSPDDLKLDLRVVETRNIEYEVKNFLDRSLGHIIPNVLRAHMSDAEVAECLNEITEKVYRSVHDYVEGHVISKAEVSEQDSKITPQPTAAGPSDISSP